MIEHSKHWIINLELLLNNDQGQGGGWEKSVHPPPIHNAYVNNIFKSNMFAYQIANIWGSKEKVEN